MKRLSLVVTPILLLVARRGGLLSPMGALILRRLMPLVLMVPSNINAINTPVVAIGNEAAAEDICGALTGAHKPDGLTVIGRFAGSSTASLLQRLVVALLWLTNSLALTIK